MSLIKRISDIFKKHKPTSIEPRSGGGESKITIEELMQDDQVANLLSQYKKQTTFLRPFKSDKRIDFTKSKMGGVPNLNGFQEWPICDECNAPLNFILQLYKTDFADFYFAENKNIFQLFRCPNLDCPVARSGDAYDQRMFHYYWNINTDKNREVEMPDLDKGQFPHLEGRVQECYFEPEVSDDYPDWVNEDSTDWNSLKHKYGYDIVDLFIWNFTIEPSTKFGGYPYWLQDPNHPDCKCGSQKEFFILLAGYEEYGLEMNGDGLINYFRCRECGEKSIETRFDMT